MPSTDYTSTGGGLKLKGAKDAGISKRKSKKSKKDKTASTAEPTTSTALEKASATPDPERIVEGEEGAQYDREKSKTIGVSRQGSSHADSTTRMKTEAEIRHEEMKRKRLDDRLKRDGMKTHKEKVEQLNKYLSGLSEHHDMPRIGPG